MESHLSKDKWLFALLSFKQSLFFNFLTLNGI